MKRKIQDRYTKATIERYNARLLKHGYSPKTLGWLKGRQGIRFSVLTSIGDMNNSNVLDVGCGFGDLYGFLLYKKYSFRYLGLEINPKLIELGRIRYPNAKFSEFNIEKDTINHKHDWIIISGLFNFKRRNKYEFIADALKKIFHSCRNGVAVDFTSNYVDFKSPDANYVSPEEIFRICKQITERIVLRHDYMPFEFSVFMYKDNAITKNLVFKEYTDSLDVDLKSNDWLKNVGNKI